MATILTITHRGGTTEIQCPSVESGRDIWHEFLDYNGSCANRFDVAAAVLRDGTEVLEGVQYPLVGAMKRRDHLNSEGDPEPFPDVVRQWDPAYPPAFRFILMRRRRTPDGEIHRVRYVKRRKQIVPKYPWEAMADGDFFLTKALSERERQIARSGMRQAAARYGMEISIRDWTIKNKGTVVLDDEGQLQTGLRVTRVCGFVPVVKMAANLWRVGKPPLQIADPKARTERDWANRKPNRGDRTEEYNRRRVKDKKPNREAEPNVPYDREAIMAARRAEAMKELG